LDLLTIGIVTIPFGFEGKMRNDQAYRGIEKLRGYVDSLVVINNNKLREVYGNLGFKAGFSKADEVLSTAARGIAEVITHHYTQNIDLRDAKTVLSNSGTAIMGSASASGENRSEIAISKALDSPLLNDNKITGAKNVLLLIVSGSEEITIDEIGEINDYIQAEAKSNVNIIMGVGEDESLGNAISVTIVATGFTKDQQHEISNTEAKKIIHTLNDEQEATFDFSEKNLRDYPIKQTNHKIVQTPNIEDKIVYDLGEEIEEDEEDFKIISTSEFIKNIDVVYEEIAHPNDNDFIITSYTQQIEEPVLQVEEEKQISFTFDLPLSEFKNKPKVEEQKNNINAIEVNEHKHVSVIKKVEEDIYFTLEDYAELEDNLTKAVKPAVNAVKSTIEDEMNFTLSSKPEMDVKEYEVVDYKEVSPLDLTIAELQQRAADRREKMKNFNYKFSNKLSKNIDEMDKEPAYKRMGIELDQPSHSSEFYQSRTTLQIDDTDAIQFRSNNSFLHDNVD
jgi:cell division protein FtsZ